MSNKRIDLEAINMPDMKDFTEEAVWQGWYDTVEEMIAELKRMYRLEDDYRNLLNQYWLDEGWPATCKADGEGECRLEIETLDELMELVANETVEIPEYSHSSDELILYEEHCTCGVSHEEWMISTGRASE